jgi:prevent-host-death family protein
MSTVNMRELSRNTKSVIEQVVRSGRPAIVTVNGRPQVAVAPIVGALEAVEERVLQDAPAQIVAAVREGEADLIAGKVSVVDDATFARVQDSEPAQPEEEILAEITSQLDTDELKGVIRVASPSSDESIERVREALAHVNLLTLGRSSSRRAGAAGDVSDVVTYVASDEEGSESIAMPVFTDVAELRAALLQNPRWQSLQVLPLSGRGLIENIDPDVTIAIDPWSSSEFKVPPTSHRTLPTSGAIATAADLLAMGE